MRASVDKLGAACKKPLSIPIGPVHTELCFGLTSGLVDLFLKISQDMRKLVQLQTYDLKKNVMEGDYFGLNNPCGLLFSLYLIFFYIH